MKRIVSLVLGLWLLPAFAATPPPASAPEPLAPEPGYEYFQPSDFFSPTISPGGKSAGFIVRTKGHTRLYRLDLGTGQVEGIFDPGEGDIYEYWWISDARLLIKGRGKNGDVYFTYDLETRKSFDLPKLLQNDAGEIRFYPNLQNQVVISLQEMTNVLHESSFANHYLASVDLTTGREKRISSYHGGVANAVISAGGELRAEGWMQGATWHVRTRESAKAPWQEIKGEKSWPAFMPFAMAADDRRIVGIAYDQDDTATLIMLDPATGQRTSLAAKPGRDVNHLDGSATIAAAVFYDTAREDALYLDPALAALQLQAQHSLPGNNTRIQGSTPDHRAAIILNWNSGQPFTFYLFANGRLSLLGQQRDSLKPGELGRLQVFSYKTRDGLEETGYVTLPAKSAGPCPLLVLAPEFIGRTAPSGAYYDEETQYYTSRGYAVARFITRGHNGLGRKFESKGDFSLLDSVLDDMEDGIGYLTGEKIADPARVALYGYGDQALLALYAARKTPPYRAVILQNPGAAPNANKIHWQSSQRIHTADIVKEAGGVAEAYRMMRKFDPVETVPALQVPALLVSYGINDTSDIEKLAAKHHKVLDRHKTVWQKAVEDRRYNFHVARAIADFLDARLKAAAP